MEFVPKAAPLVVLMFLGTGFLLALLALLFVYTLWKGERARAIKVLLAGVVVGAGYLGVLLASSFASEEKVLRADEWKYFCEIDCHLAYSVESVATTKTLGSGASEARADGTFYVVTLKTWFDPKTISPRRGNGLLFPNPRTVRVVDDAGRQYATSLEGQKALDRPAAQEVALDQPLRPGDSYKTTLVFDLPDSAKNPRLFLTDPDPVNILLIGHENSFFHKKIYFGLQAAPANAENNRH